MSRKLSVMLTGRSWGFSQHEFPTFLQTWKAALERTSVSSCSVSLFDSVPVLLSPLCHLLVAHLSLSLCVSASPSLSWACGAAAAVGWQLDICICVCVCNKIMHCGKCVIVCVTEGERESEWWQWWWWWFLCVCGLHPLPSWQSVPPSPSQCQMELKCRPLQTNELMACLFPGW